ncbi:S8 family peptidase [Ammoniphilus resinae]|uniref:Subtilisin family serine protease n=1 Tax=Ammoniphilus resinae TaxID=861532 RepID=A0ABS4GRE4_9BACL|nr:S8 family peptidase [Ammoniphilus resinae]MBP1932852.1 subtilisin family serine protease [Ammoniphilus resinae]
MKIRIRLFSAITACIMLMSIVLSACGGTSQQNIHTAEDKKPIHLPNKIDFISQVDQTVKSLNNSPHILTIHHNSQDKSHAIKNEVTVKFKSHPDHQELARISQLIDGKIKKHWDSYSIFKSKSKTTDQLIQYFKTRDDVLFAEPNFILLPNREPNDPLYTQYQWNLPIIKADRAWDISPGRANITVAVVDTGVDLKHEDFKGKLVKGYNVLLDNNNPMDDNGHGTHVSGIISAGTNNTIGIAGVSWNNRIMPVKAIGAEGTGTAFDIAKGIKWAADHGARVINMSVGNYHPSQVLHDAVRYAYDKGIVLIAASGNDNTDQPSYPAAYPEVLSIAAVDNHKRRAEFSNYGKHIDVAAPGVDIPSTYIYSEYAVLSGTSMACPHVSGLAGLILSVNPNLSNREVAKIIRQSAKDLGSRGKDQQYGYGLIDVDKALIMAKEGIGTVATPSDKKQLSEQERITFFPFRAIREWFGF